MRSDTLTEQEWAIVDDFHRLYYGLCPKWAGLPVLKNPMDLCIYQEIIWQTQPDTLIECGTAWGASTLFFAHMMDLVGKGQIISIDIYDQVEDMLRYVFGGYDGPSPVSRPEHPRIVYVKGDSVSPLTVRRVRRLSRGKVMVVLDSDHHASHVRRECEAYGALVTPGCYLCVEDVNVNGHPIRLEGDVEGPYEAAIDFLLCHDDFKWNTGWTDRFLMSYNAYLYRVERESHGVSPEGRTGASQADREGTRRST